MAKSLLTVQVHDLSPKVTATDLNTFFSYCGTVEKIILERKEDQSQLAFVTFRQPYAVQTALLLNNATIVDRRVRILPSQNSKSPPISESMNSVTKEKEKQCVIPSQVKAIACKGCEQLNKVKGEFDERYKLSEKGRVLKEQTHGAMSVLEQAAGRVGEAIVNNNHFSAAALWVSGELDKAAKCAAQLGSYNNKKDHLNSSRKQK